MTHHLFEMSGAKDGFGIVAEKSDLIRKKKLKREDALHSGDFNSCITMREHFQKNPFSLAKLKEDRELKKEKEHQKRVKTLIKKVSK